MRLGIRLVGELAGVEGVGIVAGDLLRHILVVLGVSLAHIGAREHHLGAHGAQVGDLLITHLVGNDHREAVALLPRHERERETRVARSRLDDAAALLELA